MNAARAGFWASFRTLPGHFWCVMVITAVDRFVRYGVRAVAFLYVVNALLFKREDANWVLAVWAMVEMCVPLVSGCYTDRYGVRRSLIAACAVGIVGYIGMAQLDWAAAASDGSAARSIFLWSACFMGVSGGILRAAVFGAVAGATRQTAAQSWGLVYLFVNGGAFMGPLVAGVLLIGNNPVAIFYGAAFLTALNLFLAMRLYREPLPEMTPSPAGPVAALPRSMMAIARDPRFLIFLAILTGFYLVNDLFGHWLTIYLSNWFDTTMNQDASLSAWRRNWLTTFPGLLAAALLPLLVWLVWKRNAGQIIAWYMLIAIAALALTGLTSIFALCVVGCFIYALAETTLGIALPACVGLNAPAHRKATYMGWYIALPALAASLLAGVVPFVLPQPEQAPARAYLAEHLGVSEAFAADGQRLPDEVTLPMVAHVLQHNDGPEVEMAIESRRVEVTRELVQGIEDAEGIDRRADGSRNVVPVETSKAIVYEVLGAVDDDALREATRVLRTAYRPRRFTFYYTTLGLLVVIAMFIWRPRIRKGALPG